MDRRQLYAALRHHPRRDRAVETAADEDRRAPAGADRDTARTGLCLAVDIRALLADLNAHNDVRVVHVNREVRVRTQQSAADLAGDLHRVEREFLVRALRFHLEGLDIRERFLEVLRRSLENRIHRLRADARARVADHAEHLRHALLGLVDVRVRILRDDVDRRLHRIHVEVAGTLDTPPDIFQKPVLKNPAVQPLEDDFAELDQNHFLHISTTIP